MQSMSASHRTGAIIDSNMRADKGVASFFKVAVKDDLVDDFSGARVRLLNPFSGEWKPTIE